MPRSLWALLPLVLAACAADGGSTPTQVCTPGETQACVCPGGNGAQSCNARGSGWLACQCAAQDLPDGSAPPPPPSDAGDCTAGETRCDALCTRLDRDPLNCGACGQACPAGSTCTSGACQLTCSDGQTRCGSACVNTSNDEANCGGCRRACAAGQFCDSGACITPCPTGQSMCASRCVDTRTDPSNCGACGTACSSGMNCTAGACTASSPPVSVAWSYPGFWPQASGAVWFPNYLSRLFDPAPAPMLPMQFEMACADITSNRTVAQSVDLRVDWPVFGAPATATVSVPAMGHVQRCLDPIFNYAVLDATRANTPAGLRLQASVAGAPVSTATYPFTVLPSNAIVWSPQGALSQLQQAALVSVYVQPNNPDIVGLRSDAERNSGFSNFGNPPFDRQIVNWAYNLPNGYEQRYSFFMENGESITAVLALDGGSVGVSLFTLADYTARAGGASVTPLVNLPSAVTSSNFTYMARADGWYVLTVANAGTAPRAVSLSRSATRFDVAYDVLQAVFLAVRNRGVVYSSLDPTYSFTNYQNIRPSSEVLAMSAGNCIDGTLVFAGVFENIAMLPQLRLYQCTDLGHAIAAVRVPGATYDWPIETTMVGGSQTPWQAMLSALDTEANHTACVTHIEVAGARRAGIAAR